MSVMNQFPHGILDHKKKSGREKPSDSTILSAWLCLSHILQEILVITWIIKAKPVTASGCRHQPPMPMSSQNTESKGVKGFWWGFVVVGVFFRLSSSFC